MNVYGTLLACVLASAMTALCESLSDDGARLYVHALTDDDVVEIAQTDQGTLFTIAARLESEKRCYGDAELVNCLEPLRTEPCRVIAPDQAEALRACTEYLQPRRTMRQGREDGQ